MIRCSKREDELIIYTSVENNVIPIFSLQFFTFHTRTGMLNRIEHVDPTVNKGPNEFLRRSVGMKKHLQIVGMY